MNAPEHIAVPTPVLEALGLSIVTASGVPALVGDLTVWPGELHLVFSPTVGDSSVVTAALLGLAGAGEVRFQGAAWAELDPQEARRLRGRIGSVMSRGNWLETRSVMENLLLPLRHHTVMREDVLHSLASELALGFGLPGIPMLLPHQCSAADLERAACVRAFLGRPQLVMLEHPVESAGARPLPALVDAIRQVRRRDGAVVWFTRSRAVMEELAIVADRRYRIADSRLLDMKSTA